MDTEFDPTRMDLMDLDAKHFFEYLQAKSEGKNHKFLQLLESKRLKSDIRRREEQIKRRDKEIRHRKRLIKRRSKRIIQLDTNLRKMGRRPSRPDPEKKRRSGNAKELKGRSKTTKGTDDRHDVTQDTSLPVTRQRTADIRHCGSCDSALPDTGSEHLLDVIDIENGKICRTRWTVMRRHCKNCQAEQSAKIPGVMAGQKYGNDLMAQVAMMHGSGMPLEGISDMFYTTYNVRIAESELMGICDTVAAQLRSSLGGLRDETF